MLEINSVKTVFENNGVVSPNEEIVGYDKNITPDEQALLKGLNYQAYPTLQELSEGKGITSSQEKQGIKTFNSSNSEEKRATVERMGRNGWDAAKATEEYMGELAEKDFKDFDAVDRSIWKKLKARVLEWIDRVLSVFQEKHASIFGFYRDIALFCREIIHQSKTHHT